MNLENFEDRLYYSTVLIKGSNMAGTGFFLEYTYENNNKLTFLITNKHVVAPSNSGVLNLFASKYPAPNKEVLEEHIFTLDIPETAWKKLWLHHPDDEIDLSIFNFTPAEEQTNKYGNYCFYSTLSNKDLINIDDIKSLRAIEPIYYIGYPFSLRDKKTELLPISRGGVTASPVYLNFDGEKKFLIDSPIFQGTSGGPVCIINRSNNERNILAGILCSTRIKTDENLALNLGDCIHAQCIEEAVLHHYPNG